MTTHCKGIDNLIPSGNDFYLAVTLKSRSLVDGEVVETPFDFEAADTYNARIYGILDGTTLSTMVGLKDGTTDTVIIDAKGVPLIRAIGVEVTGTVDGRAFRAAEKGFLSIVEFNGEAKVVFTPVTGGQQANLVMTLTFLPSAAVVGKNAYEIWKEEPGNQDKTLADFIYFLGHGESAYEIAVRYGYTGTEAEYNMLYFDAVDVANTAGQNAQQAADTANEMAAQAQDAAERADAATTNANNAATAAAATVDAAIDNMENTLNAAIAAQDAEIDEQFATQTALINQKQMEVGAVPSDLTPTPNSTNWVTSGGVYANIHSLGEKCALPSQTETTQEAEVGQWQPTTGAIATTDSNRAHMKILCKNYSSIKVIIPSGWYCGFYYVDDNNVSLQDITQGWQTGTVEFSLNGFNDIMLNIKYGSAGTTTIDQTLLNGVLWQITLYFSGGYKPAAPYDEFSDVKNDVDGVTPFDNAPTSGSGKGVTSDGIYKGCAIVDTDNSADLSFSDGNENKLVEFKSGHIRTKYFNSADLVGQHTYKGGAIQLGKHYLSVEQMMSITHTITRSVQGCAVYGDYLFVAEDYIYTIAVYNLQTKVLINVINLTSNSNYHCNNISFGTWKYTSGDATPCLYVSQEKESEHKVLVYQVQFSGTFSLTLVQTLTMPAPQLGVYPYYPNAMIDADNGYLFIMGYSEKSYTESDTNKIIVLKYALPHPTDGDITLPSTDIYAKFPSITATQGGCFYGGYFYQSFGGASYGSLVVRTSDLQNLVNRLDLTNYGISTEPEAACVYDDTVLIVGIDKKVYQIKFYG